MPRKKDISEEIEANIKPKDKLLTKLTGFFFDRPRLSAIFWVALAVFGILSYTTFLRREGFPSVNIPMAIVSGTYFANDPAKVDTEVAKPLADLALKEENISAVDTQSSDNFFSVSLQYKEGTDAKAAADVFKQKVEDSGILPQSANVAYNVPYFGATGGDTRQIDLAISFYDKEGTVSTADLTKKAEEAAAWLSESGRLPDVESVFVKSPFETVTDPSNGGQVTVERSFDRFGIRHEDQTHFYNSVIIGMAKTDGADVITMDEAVREKLEELTGDAKFAGFGAEVSASFAPSIEESISELQRVLLEGLLAVLVVGSLVIAIRASVITVISMITVLVASLGFLYITGYTLNVITLFALILSLALIVDDTIIMVEAIDAARRKSKDRRAVIREATTKVSRAMVAATVTASLSFAPLLFVGGILGDFIAAIPITIIASLVISLLVALIFIPFFSRFLLLGDKQLGKKARPEISAGFEAKLAAFIAGPMLWARNSKKKLLSVGLLAIFIGFGFIAAAMFIARDVVFNIFPPTKDTNAVAVSLHFPPNTTIDAAKGIADKADQLTAEVLSSNFVKGSYFGTGSAQSANLQAELISYSKRDIKSPDIVKELQERFNAEFKEATATVGQVDIGPPAAAFTIELAADNRDAAYKASADVANYLKNVELKRVNNTIARMKNVEVSSSDQYIRNDGKPVVLITANFDGTDTSTLVTLAQDAVETEFPESRLESYGLSGDALAVDLGQEEENQESFNTLVFAFPVLLLVMYVLLGIQFRSFLQPLLIFLAIPFSLFGIMFGLNLTDNAISFFTMLGFFALLGLSIKNTILLTDFANQAKRAGYGTIDATVAALEERFRPLFATSMTAVVSLIPLAYSSPFWEGLAVVLIFGLLSNTLLVLTVFPYYYLGAEFLRSRISAKVFLIWLALLIVGAVIVGMTTSGANVAGFLTVYLVGTIAYAVTQKLRRSSAR